jgi:hypothetical protein
MSGFDKRAFLIARERRISVVTSKAAIRGYFKTGHRDWPET